MKQSIHEISKHSITIHSSLFAHSIYTGLSGDEFHFDDLGDGPARYRVIHFKRVDSHRHAWVQVGKYSNGHLYLNKSCELSPALHCISMILQKFYCGWEMEILHCQWYSMQSWAIYKFFTICPNAILFFYFDKLMISELNFHYYGLF